MNAAGRLTIPVTVPPSGNLTIDPGAEANAAGISMPAVCNRLVM